MISGLNTAPFVLEQKEAVINLWKDCGLLRPWNDPSQDIDFAVKSPCATVLVGSLEREVIATVMVGYDGHRGVLYYLAVAPAYQKQGGGAQMVCAAENWLKARGVWKINFLVRAENHAVSQFYEKLGYAQNPAISFGKRLCE